eukprot:6206619-Pleurochrysis_carterae.AAC.3
MSSIRPGLTVLKLAVLPGALFMATASAASTPRYTRHSVYTLAILEGLLRMALNLIGESTSCSEYACLLTGEPGMLDCWRVAFSWRKDGLRPFASRPLLEKSERGERLALCDSCAAATGVRGTLTRVRTPAALEVGVDNFTVHHMWHLDDHALEITVHSAAVHELSPLANRQLCKAARNLAGEGAAVRAAEARLASHLRLVQPAPDLELVGHRRDGGAYHEVDGLRSIPKETDEEGSRVLDGRGGAGSAFVRACARACLRVCPHVTVRASVRACLCLSKRACMRVRASVVYVLVCVWGRMPVHV